MTRNLNKIIDINYYPVETARRSNMRHRPIGIGVQARPRTGLTLISYPVETARRSKMRPRTIGISVQTRCRTAQTPKQLACKARSHPYVLL